MAICIILPEIQQPCVPQLLFAFEGLDPANQSGLQPLGLFLFMSLRDRAANLALDTIPKRLPLSGIEVDECAAFVEPFSAMITWVALPRSRCAPMICISFSSKHLILRQALVCRCDMDCP
ncbi:hypothetical protein [Mesorhizobium sp. M1143]|uniref:hypothetical protein n=1 Tax=Mesorhizobium sp. M1143 TaxID=2957061 RepID=UPI0033385A99